MIKNKKNKFFLYTFIVIFLIGLIYFVFNEHGLIKYMKLANEIDSLNQEISTLKKENENLNTEIDSLKKGIPAKIEKLAREKYDMIKEGEQIIEVKVEENVEK